MGRKVLCKQLFCGTCCPCAICIVKTSAQTAHGEGVLSAGETDAHCNRKLSRRGESRGGCRSDLDIRQPPLGVLWLLSGAPESNIVASAEAMNATTKIKQEERKRLRRVKSRIPAFCAQKRPFTRTQCHPSTAPAAAALRSRADTASIPLPRRCLPECSTPRRCQSTASHPQ